MTILYARQRIGDTDIETQIKEWAFGLCGRMQGCDDLRV